MTSTHPYQVKKKEYRLDKNDDQQVETVFSIKGPTVCSSKFSDESSAQMLCDMLNEAYHKGYGDGCAGSNIMGDNENN